MVRPALANALIFLVLPNAQLKRRAGFMARPLEALVGREQYLSARTAARKELPVNRVMVKNTAAPEEPTAMLETLPFFAEPSNGLRLAAETSRAGNRCKPGKSRRLEEPD